MQVGRGSATTSLHGQVLCTGASSSPPSSFYFLARARARAASACRPFCENFGVTQKPSQTWACFTRCLGKSGKATKANSCASDTRHALLYAPSARTCMCTRADASMWAYKGACAGRGFHVWREDAEKARNVLSYSPTSTSLFINLLVILDE